MCWKRERRGGDVKSVFCWLMSKTLRYWWWSAFIAVWRRTKRSLRWLSAFGHQTSLNSARFSDKSDGSERIPAGSHWWQAEWRMEGKRRWRNFMIQRTETLRQTHKSLNGPKIQFTLNSKGRYVAVIWLSSNNSSCASDIFPSGAAVCGSSVTFGNW